MNFIFDYVYECVWGEGICMWLQLPTKAWRYWSSRYRHFWIVWHGCWKPNKSPVQEQHAPLLTETSFQCLLKNILINWLFSSKILLLLSLEPFVTYIFRLNNVCPLMLDFLKILFQFLVICKYQQTPQT